MAQSTCPKCGSHSFELAEAPLSGAKFRYCFIQCSSCGCVVGVTDHHNVPSLLEKLAKRLGVNFFN